MHQNLKPAFSTTAATASGVLSFMETLCRCTDRVAYVTADAQDTGEENLRTKTGLAVQWFISWWKEHKIFQQVKKAMVKKQNKSSGELKDAKVTTQGRYSIRKHREPRNMAVS